MPLVMPLRHIRKSYGFILLLGLIFSTITSHAQDAPFNRAFEQLDEHLVEQKLLHQGNTLRHTAVKPLLTSTLHLHETPDSLESKRSWFNRKWFLEHLIHYQGNGFDISVDPVFDFTLGKEFNESKTTWFNTRGLQINASITEKIAISSTLYESQAMLPAYLDRFINTWVIKPMVPGVGIMPGQGIAREFGKGSWDYGQATAYISWSPSKYINLQLGNDRHFIGFGYRSLLLSDVAYPAPFVRMQLHLGPLQYTYWFTQYTDPNEQPLSYTLDFRKKYACFGYLNWNITNHIQIGAFQALIWPGDDSIGGSRPPSMIYLNPFVFLHPVHYSNGSDGNYFVGLNGQWEINNNYVLYGQFIFDELKPADFFTNMGSIANKYGLQLGLKFFEPLQLKGLYVQTEWNAVRPYTFSHTRRLTNYSQYLQPIGHPSGANFWEIVVLADYRFKGNWLVSSKLIFNQKGLDQDTTNYGGNIFRSYLDGIGGLDDRGIRIGQGLVSRLIQTEIGVDYLLNRKTNMRVGIRYINRNTGPNENRLITNWFQIGFRTSLRNLYYDF